ncbi:hypothetical protein MHU86_16025 [Fragilaria crotonensis]|nr:hypothetical protein MHU86_16025 [Fragilaria crotonensis]
MHAPHGRQSAKYRHYTAAPTNLCRARGEFVSEEMADFCRQGYWLVLPQDIVADWPKLRILPLGVVPQQDQMPRLIVDYSFSNVKSETAPLAPHEVMMHQFGRALQRVVLLIIVHANRWYGLVHMAKIDIADGFYRVWLRIDDVPQLGVELPTAPGLRPLVVFPWSLPLPMGWVLLPPYFAVLTATACDLANAVIKARLPYSRITETHRLEAVADTLPSAADSGLAPRPDCGLRYGMLPILGVSNADVACLCQEDAKTVRETLHLPPHRVARLHEVLSWLRLPRKRLPRKQWYQLLGKVRSMSPALPGTQGLFSVRQDALSNGDRHRIRLNQHIYSIGDDFRALVNAIASRPTRLRELVTTLPSDVGACDTCQTHANLAWVGYGLML